ncbi:DUF6542 domain-containing protein [Streptomyces kaniharaensis]|uniref:DUF6542 domain-containing protein n=1 Tax=Streptomyces kaniharaensis TaxID=212423 RepID=UPI0012981049|nr:DUF6542 domain-containing protein [Streptomyces kaniharaensis]
MEQSIRTQTPGPRRRPPSGAASASVPGPGRAPETAGATPAPSPASRLRPVAGPPPAGRPATPRLRLRLPLSGRGPSRLYGRRRTGRPTRLTAVGTGVVAVLATLAAAGLDRLLFGGLGWLFGLGYLVVCFQLAVRVRYADLLAAPISGPIAFALALLLLAPVSSSGVTAQVVGLATGLALRAGWLFCGTGLAALIVLARFVAQSRIHRSR